MNDIQDDMTNLLSNYFTKCKFEDLLINKVNDFFSNLPPNENNYSLEQKNKLTVYYSALSILNVFQKNKEDRVELAQNVLLNNNNLCV